MSNSSNKTPDHGRLRLIAMSTFLGLILASVVSSFANPVEMEDTGTEVGNRQNSDPSAEEKEESLDVRYARAHLELAKLDLKRAEHWNRSIPNLISKHAMDHLRKHVELDSEQLRQAIQTHHTDVHQIYLRGARVAIELAEADVVRKQSSYGEQGDQFSAIELDRSIAVAKVAKLHLERTIAQGDSMQSIGYLQWQIEELRNQILELQVRVESNLKN